MLQLQRFRWAQGTVGQQRLRQEKAAGWLPKSQRVRVSPVDMGGLSAAWVTCVEPSQGVLLYLHGGAYALGSIDTHREFLGRLTVATRLKVLAINYRLAPEHHFPAAVEDSLRAYRWLLGQGTASSSLVVGGDSAGGGLALATLMALRDAGEPLPACAMCLSPWVDLTLSSPSIHKHAGSDPLLSPDLLARYAGFYAGGWDKRHSLISPLFADLHGLPPLMIQVGTAEILLDEAVRLAEKADAAGVEVQLSTWEGLFHVFQLVSFLPESKKSLEKITAFIAKHIETDRGQ